MEAEVGIWSSPVDRALVEKVVDVVGLYLDPPALVLSADEKSQTQAPGQAGTMTHNDERHGTTTVFAALDVATGRVGTLGVPPLD